MSKKEKSKKNKQNNLGATTEKSKKLPRKVFDKELRSLQIQLCHLQEHVKKEGMRVIVVFESRDAAGKGLFFKKKPKKIHSHPFFT